MKQIRAIIFDLDGVLCHTDEYHYLAWKAMADDLGVTFDRAVNNRLRGVSRIESLDIILERYNGLPLDAAQIELLAQKKNTVYRRYLNKMATDDLPGEVKSTLHTLRSRGLKLAVGSSSKNAPLILNRLGLAGFFDALADGNDIRRSKPDPEVFLKAAERLALKPAECLIVEDAVAGAAAGHRGGFLVACVGAAAQEKAGDYNLDAFEHLLDIPELAKAP